ncbi:MAG: hypothetical protein ACK5AJ_13315 [bacterium]
MTDIATHTATEATTGVHDAEIDALFSATGVLAKGIAGFRPRQSQTDMARAEPTRFIPAPPCWLKRVRARVKPLPTLFLR